MLGFSLTGIGIATAVLGTLLLQWGFTDSCTNEITSILTTKWPLLIGGVMAYWGRFRQGDVSWLLKKKNPNA